MMDRDGRQRSIMAVIMPFCVALISGCSQASELPESQTPQSSRQSASTSVSSTQGCTAAVTDEAAEAESRVLSKKDVVLRNVEPVCDIQFVYEGMTAEGLFWEEPCADVTAKMMDQNDLEALNDWEPLDSFAKDFINAMPDGKVLYVAGRFSASVYPINTTGTFYEVAVSD